MQAETQKIVLKITNSDVHATWNIKTNIQAQSHKLLYESSLRLM